MTSWILTLGDVNIDMILPYPVTNSKGKLPHPQILGGGTAGNTAVGLARLQKPVRFLGKVGDDSYGRFLIDDFEKEGIDTQFIYTDSSSFTAMCIASIDLQGERHIYVWPPQGGSHTKLTPEEITHRVFQDISWVHTTGMALGESPIRESTIKALEIAKKMRIPISLDLNLRLEFFGWRNGFRKAVLKAVEMSDYIMGSEKEEICPLAKEDKLLPAVEKLSQGEKTIIVRQGSRGVEVFHKNERFHVPAFPVNIVDTLGAGDAFNSGFIAAMIEGKKLPEAVNRGNATAALNLTKTGGRNVPGPEELEAFLQSD